MKALMKGPLMLLLPLFFTLLVHGQQKISITYYSAALKDSLSYHVWLPQGWSPEKNYPSLYFFQYGAMGFHTTGENWVAADVAYYTEVLQKTPRLVLVALALSKDWIDYDYKTGLLGSSGLAYLQALRQEIIPAVEKQYRTSHSRTYLGHSYSASYGNYLFQHAPELFSGYVLLAPEKLEAGDPLFEPDGKLVDQYSKKTTAYYVATGGNDLDRRQAFGKEIEKKLRVMDSLRFRFRLGRYAGVDHMDLPLKAWPDALEFMYQPFSGYLNMDSVGNVIDEWRRVAKDLQDQYGLPMERNYINYDHFLQLALKNRDTAAMAEILAYFITPGTSGLEYFNFGYYYDQLPLPSRSEQYYRMAIAKSERDEMNTVQGPLNMVMSYRRLAFNTYKDDKQKGWALWQEALRDTFFKDPVIHFYIGKWAALNQYKVKEGLQQLLHYQHAGPVKTSWKLNGYEVNYYIGDCYFLLKNNKMARQYLQKALAERPQYPEAKALLDKMQ